MSPKDVDTRQNGKQCRPWSDCEEQPDLGLHFCPGLPVQKLRIITVIVIWCTYGELSFLVLYFQTEIAKRLNAICAQVIPFLSQEVRKHLNPVKRICVIEHSVMTNFNCACPAIQRGQGAGFLSEGSSCLTSCMSEQRRFWRDRADHRR